MIRPRQNIQDLLRSGRGSTRAHYTSRVNGSEHHASPDRRELALLLAIVVIGAALRLVGLEARTLTHAEFYVPRIAVPEYSTTPKPRSTLSETVVGSLHHDNHPPGYYAMMWLWTGVFGIGLSAIRLPSALAGIATLLLAYRLIRSRDGRATALTGAALLAVHGHHVFWSQHARMWVFLTLFAVASVLLLDELMRRPRRSTAIAYGVALCAGMARCGTCRSSS